MGKCKSCGTTMNVANGMCPACMAEGGEVDLERKESKGEMAEPKEKMGKQLIEGEPNDDDIMHDHIANELMEAFHNKDKKMFKDSLHYMVSDIINKMKE